MMRPTDVVWDILASLLAIVGVVIAFVAIISGFIAGDIKKSVDDPEFKKEIARLRDEREKEEKRQREWKEKIK